MKLTFPKKSALMALSLMAAVACDRDRNGEDPTDLSTDLFSSADMAILGNYLNLSATPYNYEAPDLPEHFTGGEMEGFDTMPDSNKTTDMGATLGRVLFYDKQLSLNNSIACASCHMQEHGFADTATFSRGHDGAMTHRNAMTLINARFHQGNKYGWDERANALEEMVLLPIEDGIEMNISLDSLVGKLAALEYYPVLFRNAFGSEEINKTRISKALAQYVRSIVSYETKFDKGLELLGTDETGEGIPQMPNYSTLEQQGQDIFFSNTSHEANCLYCHGSPAMVVPEDLAANQVDYDQPKNNGLELNYADNGVGEISGLAADDAKFRVPSLRNIALTAPYMHDGRFKTLEQVIDHYSDGVKQHDNLHFRLSLVDDGPPGGTPTKLNFTEQEKTALIAFLNTLTDEQITIDQKFSDPFL